MKPAYPGTTALPIPERTTPGFNVAELGLKERIVGESFLIEPAKLPTDRHGKYVTTTVAARIHVAAKRMGVKVRVAKRYQERDDEAGLRVWRIA